VFGVKFMFELLILLPLALFGGLLLDGATNDDGDPSARADVEGTAGADLLDGTDESETIAAFGGDDLVNGFGGNDDIQAGAGSDVAEGQDGDDTIAGEAGNDTVGGGFGADSLVGGDGDDAVFGDEGNDTLSGDAGKDLILGGTGDDSLDGGAGDDIVVGQDGNDTAHLGAGHDQFSGAGASETVPDTGNDLVFGEDGNDTIVGGLGADTLYGDGGDDILFSGDFGPSPSVPDALYGGDGDDVLFGDDGDRYFGGAGADSFVLELDGEDIGDQWVRFNDFVPGIDQVVIEVLEGLTDTTLSLFAGPNNSTRIALGKTIFAVVQGVSPDQIGPDDIIIRQV
jgi:Ca2+-binding RTX toxin-like protein